MNKFLSRKFILTVAFALIVVGNAWAAGKALSWQEVLTLGSVFGVYTVGNVAQKSAEGDVFGFAE